jgi:hypothetical protein
MSLRTLELLVKYMSLILKTGRFILEPGYWMYPKTLNLIGSISSIYLSFFLFSSSS